MQILFCFGQNHNQIIVGKFHNSYQLFSDSMSLSCVEQIVPMV